MNYVKSLEELKGNSLYNNVRQTDYDANEYLEGLNIVSCDYKVLFERYRGFKNVCFLVDPPYLSTDAGSYANYWKLQQYLDVLHTLKDTNYFYFTSNKSNIVELCDWLESNYAAANPFHGAVRKETRANMNYNSNYTDIMFYKRKDNE